LRAYKVQTGGKAVGLRVAEAESMVPDARSSSLRIRRGSEIMDATADTVLKEGDIVAVAGAREVLVNVLGAATQEVEDLRTARRAGGGRRRPGNEQGGRRQDACRAGQRDRRRAACFCARSRVAPPPPISPFCRHRDQSWRFAHPRRPHLGHNGRHENAGCRRPSDRCHRHGVRWVCLSWSVR